MITKREEALWQLLDDIDSASDLYRPDMDEPFVRYVIKKAEARHAYLFSDGYMLSEPGAPPAAT